MRVVDEGDFYLHLSSSAEHGLQSLCEVFHFGLGEGGRGKDGDQTFPRRRQLKE